MNTQVKKEIVKLVRSASRKGCRCKHSQFRPMICDMFGIGNEAYWTAIHELVAEKKLISLSLGWITC